MKAVKRYLKDNLGILIALAAMILFLCVWPATAKTFPTKTNLFNLLRQSSTNLMLACGMTMVIILGGIDLSVGSIIAMSGCFAAGAVVWGGMPEIVGLTLGVLSGLMASAEDNGAAKYGVYSYLKHFAANDQETNRCAFLLTYMTEQNFRENVLKPFEIVVKNFDFDNFVMGIMTSYNFLGPVPVISNKPLLTDVLRGEWGFIGSVISDYNGSYGYQISDAAVRAGNDLMLGQGMAASNQFTDLESPTLVLAMRQACKNVLYTTANSGYYADAVAAAAAMESQTSENAIDKLLTIFNVGAGVVLGAVELLVLLSWLLKKKKKAKAA